ncbi:MAG: hypothetical protein ABI183_23210 [Polyangiaceae bacterium]
MSLAPFAALAVIACGNSHSGVRPSNKASLADTYKTPVVVHEGAAANDRPPLVLTEKAPGPISRATTHRAEVSFQRG